LAVARPIPLLPPVITATFPSRAPIFLSFDDRSTSPLRRECLLGVAVG
jgi:hypothetical protein